MFDVLDALPCLPCAWTEFFGKPVFSFKAVQSVNLLGVVFADR